MNKQCFTQVGHVQRGVHFCELFLLRSKRPIQNQAVVWLFCDCVCPQPFDNQGVEIVHNTLKFLWQSIMSGHDSVTPTKTTQNAQQQSLFGSVFTLGEKGIGFLTTKLPNWIKTMEHAVELTQPKQETHTVTITNQNIFCLHVTCTPACMLPVAP